MRKFKGEKFFVNIGITLFLYFVQFSGSIPLRVDNSITFDLPTLSLRRVRSLSVTQAWDIAPLNPDGFKPHSWEEIESSFEQRNYYWDILSPDARQEVKRRLEALGLGDGPENFSERLVNWIHRTFRGSITGDYETETPEKVKEKISSIILKGSYIWGFKKEKIGEEETTPYDFDLVIILKDSDEFRRLNVDRELSVREKKYLFGEDNPRAPPRITIILIGDKKAKEAGIDYLNNKGIITTLMSNRGTGATISGDVWATAEPPLWAWHASIKDLLKSAYREKDNLLEKELTPDERLELETLEEKPDLSDEEEERLRDLRLKLEIEQRQHFKLMKRILELNRRIGYFEKYVYDNEVMSFDLIPNPFLGENGDRVVNQMIAYGVTEVTEYFFTSLETRQKMIEALDYLTLWVEELERQLKAQGIELIPFPDFEQQFHK